MEYDFSKLKRGCYRKAFFFNVVQKLSVAQVAKEMGVSPISARSYIQKSRKVMGVDPLPNKAPGLNKNTKKNDPRAEEFSSVGAAWFMRNKLLFRDWSFR